AVCADGDVGDGGTGLKADRLSVAADLDNAPACGRADGGVAAPRGDGAGTALLDHAVVARIQYVDRASGAADLELSANEVDADERVVEPRERGEAGPRLDVPEAHVPVERRRQETPPRRVEGRSCHLVVV